MDTNPFQEKPQTRSFWLVAGGCLVALVCIGCLLSATIAYLLFWPTFDLRPLVDSRPVATAASSARPAPTIIPEGVEESAEPALESTPTPPSMDEVPETVAFTVVPPEGIDQRPITEQAFSDLIRLFEVTFPHQDYFETTHRLGRANLGDRTVLAPDLGLNDRRVFQVDDERVEAQLVAITEHAYFWVERGLDLDDAEVRQAAERLENDHYPRIVNLFGQEWLPGVDNDPHFSVLHLVGSTDVSELGYFTDLDEYPSALFAESNEQELIYLNMAQLELGSDLYFGTLVHELQHLIQWNVDPNESTWLNEGLSQLAELYLGYDTVDQYEDFERQPEIRLNSWELDEEKLDAHYGAAYLYAAYFWEQIGDSAVQELSRHPMNGMASVRAVLQGREPDRTLEQFTADWTAANFLDDPAAGPRYYYRNLDLGRPAFEMRIKELPSEAVKEIDQFGTHYVDLDVRGPITVTFAGDTIAELIEAPPRFGSKLWLVPGIDDADAQLTAEFDLRGVDQATLRFSTWYDLEEDYDFAYVAISWDGGDSWDLLSTKHATAGEFGPAFNGRSADEPDAVDGWLKESVSLNSYVGRTVLIRFEVLTDYETDHYGRGNGLALDDISIPELGYHTDVETAADGWHANGFVQIGWQLPQQWAVLLIEAGPIPRVTHLPLNQLNQGQWAIEVGKGGGVLAITPLTPFVDQSASYWIQVEKQ